MGLLRCVDSTGKFLIGRFLFCVGDFSKKMPPPEELTAFGLSQLSSNRRRLEFMVQFSKAIMTSASTLLDLYTRKLDCVSLKLSKGLASLPDELLGIILKFATQHEEEGTRYAVWLSYVSRRFRRIILGDHSLWSTLCIWHDTTREIIERCIYRSGEDTDLHVVLNYNRFIDSSAVRNFIMNTCASSASRWRSLTLVGDWNEDVGSVTISQVMDHLTRQHPLLLPRLDELSISEQCYHELEGRPFWNSFGDEFSGTSLWEAPNLRVVRCTQYIPPPSFPFSSFTSFSLSLTLLPGNITNQIRGLFAFLSSRPNLSAIVLELVTFGDADRIIGGELAIGVIVCPAITSFRLSVSNFATESAKRIIRPTLEALQMPNLESFSFSFNNSGIHPSAAGILLPDPGDHGRLSSLSISARLPPPTWRNAILQKWDSMMISVPLDRIPHVSSLCVTTFGRLFFTRHEELEEGRGIELSSSLRELQLRFCDNMDGGDLEQMVQSLKDTGAWDMLDRVLVHECNLLDYESAVAIIGKERLQFVG